MNKIQLIALLQDTKTTTLYYFNLSEDELSKSYGEGKWTIRQILNHLADAETVLYDRIRRIIAVPKQVIWAFDQEAWAKQLHYEYFPIAINKNIYSAVRESIIYLADEYYEPLGSNEFVHSETGLRTLKEEFEKVALHNQNHIHQIELALAR
ncbi:MAG: DinB family protein [Chitinophagales bacterium]